MLLGLCVLNGLRDRMQAQVQSCSVSLIGALFETAELTYTADSSLSSGPLISVQFELGVLSSGGLSVCDVLQHYLRYRLQQRMHFTEH
jgi:hypothetical protein